MRRLLPVDLAAGSRPLRAAELGGRGSVPGSHAAASHSTLRTRRHRARSSEFARTPRRRALSCRTSSGPASRGPSSTRLASASSWIRASSSPSRSSRARFTRDSTSDGEGSARVLGGGSRLSSASGASTSVSRGHSWATGAGGVGAGGGSCGAMSTGAAATSALRFAASLGSPAGGATRRYSCSPALRRPSKRRSTKAGSAVERITLSVARENFGSSTNISRNALRASSNRPR